MRRGARYPGDGRLDDERREATSMIAPDGSTLFGRSSDKVERYQRLEARCSSRTC